MSLQRRLLLYLLISAPAVWAMALGFSIVGARASVNELFDTELIRLARQVQVLMRANISAPGASPQADAGLTTPSSQPANSTGSTKPTRPNALGGEADLSDMAVAVWNANGELIVSDREGADLPRRPQTSGFVDEQLGGAQHGELWRLYYLSEPNGQWLVASGQKAHERDELVLALTLTQIIPWLFVLPVLLVAMTWAVRRALAPVHDVATELEGRSANDLQPLADSRAPTEIKPLLTAMNRLFVRIEATLRRERRFTADAAHELRTPLAAVRAQWDVLQRTVGDDERERAAQKVSLGLDRMERLVTQMLALSRVESRGFAAVVGSQPSPAWTHPVAWPAVVEQAISDCLLLADRRHIEIACEWPNPPEEALPLRGDDALLTVLLRNLLDNAVRYAPEHSLVTLRFERQQFSIDNAGPALSTDAIARLGERFHRPLGQHESGSGLGVSIAQRVAELHGLHLSFSAAPGGDGMRVTLALPPEAGAASNV